MKNLILIVALFTLTNIANAKITVKTINATVSTIFTVPEQLFIDLDSNGIDDFRIDGYNVSGSKRLIINMLSTSSVVIYGTVTINKIIDYNFGALLPTGGSANAYFYHSSFYTTLANTTTNKYASVGLFINGNFYNGWIEFDVGVGGDWLSVFRYAFEDLPNTPITAGQTVSTPSSIDEVNEDLFSIYPNPVNNSFTINKLGNSSIASIRLYGLTGKLEKELGVNTKTVNTSDLKVGIYFLEIIADNKKTIKKIIKN